MATAAGPSCGPSAQGVKPPSVLRPGCCCCMQEMTPGPHFLSRGAQTFWHRARAYTFMEKSNHCYFLFVFICTFVLWYDKWYICQFV